VVFKKPTQSIILAIIFSKTLHKHEAREMGRNLRFSPCLGIKKTRNFFHSSGKTCEIKILLYIVRSMVLALVEKAEIIL